MQKTPAIALLSIRFLLGGAILCGFMKLRNSSFNLKQSINQLSTSCKLSILAQGLLGGFIFNVLLLTGLNYTTATMTGIISSLVPSIIILLSYILLKEKSSKHELFSVAIATIGVIFVNLTKIKANGLNLSIVGNLLILAALFPEALYTIVAKIHPVQACPLTYSTLINIVNAIAFTTCFIFYPGSFVSLTEISFNNWLLIILVLTTASLSFFILWTKGLETASTQQAAIVTSVVPVGACLLAVIFLDEPINLYDIVGILLVISAIAIGTIKPQYSTQPN